MATVRTGEAEATLSRSNVGSRNALW